MVYFNFSIGDELHLQITSLNRARGVRLKKGGLGFGMDYGKSLGKGEV